MFITTYDLPKFLQNLYLICHETKILKGGCKYKIILNAVLY